MQASYLNFTGQGRHVRSPNMEEKTMVGRCFLNRRPFFSRWLFSATYSSPCWAPLDIRVTSSPWTTTSCSERTNTSLSSSSRRSISLMTRWRSSTSRRRRRAASNSMLELGVTSLEEGAVAEVDGGSERASRAPVTRRKSPMEMERLVAGQARARRVEADVEGGMAKGGPDGEEGDGEGESGGWISGCGSLFSIAATMSSLVSSSWASVFLCRLFMATVPLFPLCCCPCCQGRCFSSWSCLVRAESSWAESAEMCSDPAWKLLHSLIRDPSWASAVSASEWLCSGGASRQLIGCWTHEHVSWWLGSLPLCCWCWQAVVSSDRLCAVSSSSGALPQSDLLSKARQSEASHAGIFPLC